MLPIADCGRSQLQPRGQQQAHARSKRSAGLAVAAGVSGAVSLVSAWMEGDVLAAVCCPTTAAAIFVFCLACSCLVVRGWRVFRHAFHQRLDDDLLAKFCVSKLLNLDGVPCDHCELTDMLLLYRIADFCLHPLCALQFFSSREGSSGLLSGSGEAALGPASAVVVMAIREDASPGNASARRLAAVLVVVLLPAVLLICISWIISGTWFPFPMAMTHVYRSTLVMSQISGIRAVDTRDAEVEGTELLPVA